MNTPPNLGMLLLAIWLIVGGVLGLIGGFPHSGETDGCFRDRRWCLAAYAAITGWIWPPFATAGGCAALPLTRYGGRRLCAIGQRA